MAEMGRYCKAYTLGQFREFPGWKENPQGLRKDKPQGGMRKKRPGGAPDEPPPAETQRVLTDDDHLYLQENFFVTDGIFIDENIVFDEVTPEWIDFCENTLKFEVSGYETLQPSSAVQ
jgi:hypothetical protein